MKTLEEQLHAKADAELKTKVNALTDKMRSFPESLGFDGYHGKPGPWTKLKDKEGRNTEAIGKIANDVTETLFEGLRDVYREQFIARFVDRVETMQREMESYIGELQIQQDPELR